MKQDMMTQFILGGNVMACITIGLLFLRFYRKTRDRLFAIFAIAFWLMGANWLALSVIQRDETRTLLYLIRLLAYALILIGILDKNRAARRTS